MHPKADSTGEDQRPTAAGTSGKLAIIGIVAVALAAAGTSWWVRYDSTHQAAVFWGPQAARLIRDARIVEFHRVDLPANSWFLGSDSPGVPEIPSHVEVRDISAARGLVHMRNALLEDRSYRWPPQPSTPDTRWAWSLRFRNKTSDVGALLFFSPDCKVVATFGRPTEMLSCEPIAAGLLEMFAAFSRESAPHR